MFIEFLFRTISKKKPPRISSFIYLCNLDGLTISNLMKFIVLYNIEKLILMSNINIIFNRSKILCFLYLKNLILIQVSLIFYLSSKYCYLYFNLYF